MGWNDCKNARLSWPIVLAAGMALSALPAFAQHGAAGHISSGHGFASRPIAPGRSIGGPVGSGQRLGAIHANSFGTNSPRSPYSLLPSYIHPQPNHFQGNHFQGNRPYHRRFAYGVGYLGLPFYGYPTAFADADFGDDTGTDTGQQAQPEGPAGPDYGPDGGPQGPGGPDYGPQAPYDQGYGPPPRAPYGQEGYPPPPQSNQQSAAQSAAAQNDGLDHPELTLIFNDGRPPEKVNSYVLTGSSVFVAESGHQRVIPIADLNLPATIQQNHDAGVDFELPGRQVR